MNRQIFGIAAAAVGYALMYWAVNILVDAYLGDTGKDMNPVPLSVCLGIRRSGVPHPRRTDGTNDGTGGDDGSGGGIIPGPGDGGDPVPNPVG